jgi:hypothetical protein
LFLTTIHEMVSASGRIVSGVRTYVSWRWITWIFERFFTWAVPDAQHADLFVVHLNGIIMRGYHRVFGSRRTRRCRGRHFVGLLSVAKRIRPAALKINPHALAVSAT